MRTLPITLAAFAAMTAVAAPAVAAEPDFMGQQVDYVAAAQAEVLTTPTSDFTISTHFGEAGPHWSSGHHTGLDFAADTGTGVDSADAGKVITAGSGGAYGNLVEIRHTDGTKTRYAHLNDIDVKVGQKVSRGQHIGEVGSTGNSTGPHLHFEVLQGKKHLDPEKFLNL